MKVIYCRISTDRQSHDLQLAELRAYCARRGWPDVAEYSDTISGSQFSREGLDALMKLVRRGKVDAVLCYRLDRLGRSLGHLAQLIGEFTANRVALIVPGQGIDTTASNPAATLQINILCAIAEFERELIRERVLAGIASAKGRGVKFGRPRTSDNQVEKVTALLSAGRTTRQVAAVLQMAKSTVATIAKRSRERVTTQISPIPG